MAVRRHTSVERDPVARAPHSRQDHHLTASWLGAQGLRTGTARGSQRPDQQDQSGCRRDPWSCPDRSVRQEAAAEASRTPSAPHPGHAQSPRSWPLCGAQPTKQQSYRSRHPQPTEHRPRDGSQLIEPRARSQCRAATQRRQAPRSHERLTLPVRRQTARDSTFDPAHPTSMRPTHAPVQRHPPHRRYCNTRQAAVTALRVRTWSITSLLTENDQCGSRSIHAGCARRRP